MFFHYNNFEMNYLGSKKENHHFLGVYDILNKAPVLTWMYIFPTLLNGNGACITSFITTDQHFNPTTWSCFLPISIKIQHFLFLWVSFIFQKLCICNSSSTADVGWPWPCLNLFSLVGTCPCYWNPISRALQCLQ